jgi:DNA polymerase
LDEGFKSGTGEDFVMTLPSGRAMTYRNIRCEVRVVPDKDGKPRKKRVFTAEVAGRRYGFYGGALTENLVQATSRDIFATHLLAVERAGVGEIAFHVHDEVIVEADLDTPKEEVVNIMRQAPEWMPNIPLDAEAADADQYKK